MYSVTGRIGKIKQPWGGYLKRRDFNTIQLDDQIKLHEEENIYPALIGLAVDYLTRFMMGTPVEKAFEISCLGAEIAKEKKNAMSLLGKIKGLDKKSVSAACKVVGYDVCFRAGMGGFKPVSEINPDDATIENIITMVKRGITFWGEYGPIILDGFTFEGGYTAIISTGDGDYLTKDTLWDFKVLKEEPRAKYTLQLLVYYIMGMHSIHKEFKTIKYLGIFNPRFNKIYRYPVKSISEDVIKTVSHDVIGYGWTKEEYLAFKKKEFPLLFELQTPKETLGNRAVKEVGSLKIGDRVYHKRFGNGTILLLEEYPSKVNSFATAKVLFDSGETKIVITNFIEKV